MGGIADRLRAGRDVEKEVGDSSRVALRRENSVRQQS
jgi:hypothetical protein